METRIPTVANDPSAGDPNSWEAQVAHATRPPPWGYIMTVVWTVLSFLIGAIGAVGFAAIVYGSSEISAIIEKLDDVNVRYDGGFTSVVYLASAIVQFALLVIVIRARKWPVDAYLALNIPSRWVMVQGTVALIAVLVIVEAITSMLGHGPVTEFQMIAYRTAKAAGQLPLLFFVVVVVAPIAEEIVFRGFMYRGFVRRPGHEPYAIVILSIVFMAAHPQYEWVPLISVFVLSLLLGLMRWWSGSTGLTILLHMLTNAIAMVATVIYIEWAGK